MEGDETAGMLGCQRQTRIGRSMFLTVISPPSWKRTSMRLPMLSFTIEEMQMPPGSASGSSRAAMLTPSPIRSPSLLDDIAKMDTDTKLHAALGWKASVPLYHTVLHLDGASDSIDDASELDENAIARAFDDTSVVQRDSRIEQITTESTQPRKRPLLVGSS